MIINNKIITTVVSDFDGTIIKEGMINPPPYFFEVVEQLLEQNIPFIAASGRQYANLRRILAPIADRINYIAENGCLVVYQDKIIYKNAIDRDIALELIADLEQQNGTGITVSGENTSYLATDDTAYISLLKDTYKNNVTVLKEFRDIEEDIIKISIYWNTGIPSDIKQWFHNKYDSVLQVADGGNGWLDFNSLTSGKGPALQVLAAHMGINTDNIVAFGDNENDITMLKEAGVSYAVASAKPHVKSVADCICESVEDTLVEALKSHSAIHHKAF